MILLDSSGWIEIFLNGPLAPKFESRLRKSWVLSTMNLFEVYRKIAKTSEDKALQAVTFMQQGEVIPMTEVIALEAADLSLQYGLGAADSIILATAYHCHAILVTKDKDFSNLPHCEVLGVSK